MAQGDVNVEMTNLKAMKCAVFDGTDDYIVIPHSSNLYDVSKFTISAWVQLKNLALVNGIFTKYAAWGSDGILFRIDTSRIKFRLNDTANSPTEITSSTDLTAHVWHHVAAVRSSTHIHVYLDGASDAAPVADSTGTIDLNDDLHLGTRNNVDYFLKGSIANVKYFNVALTATEILQLFNKEKVKRGLVSQWEFKGSYNDSVGSNNGTNHGSYLSMTDETLAAAIKAQRVTAGDHYMLSGVANGQQVINTHIEEI